MRIGLSWAFCYPATYKELLRLLSALDVPKRKINTHYAYWADLPKCRM